MEHNLFKYIIRHTRNEQAVIIGVVLVSQLFYFLSLDLPKRIVNRAIQGEGFDAPDATAIFLALRFAVPDFLSGLGLRGTVSLFDGVELERIPYLVALSLTFLLLVIINGAFKYQINTQKGRLGERMLRRLRFDLFDRMLRFPQPHFRRVKQAEIATMIKEEVEPLGGFIGDAFVQPAFLGGQALTALVFILVQSLYLGAVTVGILVLQAVIIPKLRVRVLILGKQRQLTARQLAGRIAECVDGATEIHAHDTSNFERADMADRLGTIFGIRFELYQRKFAVKFLNNLLAQFTPFLFYLIGGYLAITGRLDIGGLVAVIAAYKDLPGPVKELIDWDQQRQDVQIKYEQVIEQFNPEGMLPASLQDPAAPTAPLDGRVTAGNLTLIDETEGKLLDGISFDFDLAEHVAVTGPAGGGKEALALVLAGLVKPTGGTLGIGALDLLTAPEAVTGRRLSYVGQEAYLFPTSLRDNLLFGLKHQPLRPPAYDDHEGRRHQGRIDEARRSGNPEFDFAADWIDYAAAGATGPGDIDDRLIEAMRLVELFDDTYQFGLRGTIVPDRRPGLTAKVLAARQALHGRLADSDLATLIEPFDGGRYNKNMSIGENLLFGTAVGAEFADDRLADNDYLRGILDREGLTRELLEVGHRIAETMIELFADLPPGHPFFEQFSFIASDDLSEYQALAMRVGKAGLEHLGADDRGRLMALAFPYVEARHRLGLIDAGLEQRLLGARRAFADNLPAPLRSAVEFYDVNRYNAAATLQDNILFGRLAYGQARAAGRVMQSIGEVLDELDLRRAVTEVGLDFHVGIAGKRLSAAQRQKVGIARALVKRPDLLVVNQATAVLDNAAQIKVMENILDARRGRGVFWALHRADMARDLDRVLVLRDGKVVEQGKVAELDRPGTAFSDLVAAA